MEKNYFLKKNYEAREHMEIKLGEYWDYKKISKFNLFQNFPAYQFCRKIQF